MAKIVKTKWNNINGGTDRTDIYPITSDRAVYNADNKTMREIIRVRGVVNISTYFTYDGTPEVLTLEKAIAKITEENRCPGFLATILTTEGWFTFRYSANTIDDSSWSNTDNWIVFHAGRLEVLATSPLHLALSLKNYIYTLQGYIDAVNANQDGYLTKEDYQKLLQALEDIKTLFGQMSAVENRVTNIEGDITDINNSIGDINNSIGDINNNINNLGDSIEEINKLIEELRAALASLESSISNLKIATIVDELPTENINTNTIYLVPAANQENLNKYAEYVYADGEWEKLGEVQLETDLTGYVKEEDLDDLVSKLGYIKAADIPDSPVTSVLISNDSDDSTGILNINPDEKQVGDVEFKIGVDKDALNNYIKNYPDWPDVIVNNSINIWFALAESEINVFMINRSSLYPSKSNATTGKAQIIPSTGDIVFVTFITDASSSMPTCSGQGVYVITAVNDDTYTVTRDEADGKYAWWSFNTGSDSTVSSVQLTNEDDATGILTISPTEAQSGRVVINLKVSEENLKKWINDNLDLSAGVSSIKATSLSEVLIVSPTDYKSGQVEMQFNIDEDALKAWIENHITITTGVTSLNAYNRSIAGTIGAECLNVSVTPASTGDVSLILTVDEEALRDWLTSNGFGGNEESSSASIWVGEGNQNISPYGSIARSDLYPSSDYGTPQVGDAILWFYINADGVQTVVIAEVTGVLGSTVSTSTKLSWTIGSGEGGAVDTVQIKHTDDDTTNILTINPTDAQSGNVAVGLGISESNLRSWLINNGFGGGEINVYPDVDNSVSNPTDIYFTSNQLITGSASGSFTMTFHSTNGVAGAEVQIILLAGNNGATITIAGNSAVVTDEYTTVTVEANKYVELNAIFDGSKIYVRSSSKES